MSSVSLDSPQTLNLYAYCTNDPINYVDPSGLGFFSFLGKLFKAIGKVIKILAVVLVVVVVVALVIAYVAPAGSLAISFAKFLLFKLAPVLAQILGGLTGFQTGSITMGPGGSPPWNPNAGGSRTRFGGFFQGQDPLEDVIKIDINACRNGEEFPDCGIIIDVPPPREPMEMGTIPVRAILRGLRGLIRRIRGIRPVRSLKDVGTLRGATRQEIERLIPKDWIGTSTRTGNGIRYANLVRPGDQIRIMPGNRLDPQLIKQGPYAVLSRSGVKYRIPLEGNPTLQ
jgi:hypothetical protein